MNNGSLVRKAGLALVATLVALAGLAPFAPGASAAGNYTQIRYGGSDRFDTAALIAAAIADATPTAVLARADIFPDALTGAFAAASNGDGPLLLSRRDSVPGRTLDALVDEGVENVVLLGGTAALSVNVENQLREAGYGVSRIFGANRYQTAIEIAEDGAGIIGTIDGQRSALLSSGLNFPDALSGAPLSFAAGLPSLLTPPNLQGPPSDIRVFNDTVAAMNRLNIAQVYILGGPAAVAQDVEDRLRNEGFGVTRLAGGNRSATSVEVFEFGMDKGIYTNRRFGVARGDTFPDALAYGPLGGRPRTTVAPTSGAADTGGSSNGLLLAASHCTLSDAVETFLIQHQNTWTQGEILGGPAAICEDVAQQIKQAASTGRASITLNSTATAPGGTITGRITGEGIATVTVSGCGLTNQPVNRDAEGDFSVTIPESQKTDCTLTFTTTFTDGTSETDQFAIDITEPAGPDVVLSPASGPSGTKVTASLTGSRAGEVTDVSEEDPDCSISNEQDEGTARSFTVTGTPGSACTITSTVTYTDGGTPTTQTFTDTFSIAGETLARTATVRPELQSATIGTTSTSGTLVTYCFDEEVTGTTAPVAARFHVYDFDGEGPENGGGTPTISSTNNNCVQVNFANIQTTAAASRLSVATVDFGAVMDNEGSENPIGDAPIGSGQQTTLTAGTTTAPDLLSVSDCAAEPTGTGVGADGDGVNETRCTFTFDERAYTVTPAGFHLVLKTNEQINCVAVAGVAGGMPEDRAVADADTTIVAECQQTTSSGGIATTDVARGFVDPNTVSDDPVDAAERTDNTGGAGDFGPAEGEGCDVAGDNDPILDPLAPCEGNLNPLQATDTPDEVTPAPDLVTATLVEGGTTSDQIVYTFDETVSAGTGHIVLAGFCYYNVDSSEVCATTANNPDDTAVRGADDRTVVVTYPEGALAQAVGASVRDGAVRDVNGNLNQEDEEGMANSNQSAIAAGRTDNPDLTGVAVQTVTGQTGSTFRAVYTFDEDIDLGPTAGSEADNTDPAVIGKFFLIASDGTRYVATACETRTVGEGTPAGTEDTDNTVHCTEYAIANTAGGSTGVVPTNTALMNAVVGTVDDGAVREEFGDGLNPEGAEVASGSTGTPAA